MVYKGTEAAFAEIAGTYREVPVFAYSGNYVDRRARARSHGGDCSRDTVRILKTTVDDLCRLSVKEFLLRSAMAGSIEECMDRNLGRRHRHKENRLSPCVRLEQRGSRKD